MLADKTVRDLLAALASPTPTPGGGSAAALASSAGAALLVMVASHQKTRTGHDDERAQLQGAAGVLRTIQAQLTDAIDGDAAAYEAVVAAYRQPKETDGDKTARRQAVQRALRGATDMPLQVMRLASAALEQAAAVGEAAYRPAATDARAGVALLRAGFDAGRLNVAANIDGVTDSAYVEGVKNEVDRLAANAAAAAARADDLLSRR